MPRRPHPVVRQPLQQVTDVDERRARDGRRGLELARVERINLQPADTVLEEQRADPEVRVRHDARVALRLNDGARDGRVVEEPQLRVCVGDDAVEEVVVIVAQLHRHGETSEHVEREGEALDIEFIQRPAETWQLVFGGTQGADGAAMLVALLVVAAAVGFCSVSGVALVDLGVVEFPS